MTLPWETLPQLGTHLTSSHFRIHNKTPGKSMLFESKLLASPSAEFQEALMGFRVSNTGPPCLSQIQCIYLLGKCIDFNAIS